jgi:Carboxypeptidase regulatory-like domain
MKSLAAVVLALICCAFAAGECVVVVNETPSPRNARITVLVDGKPQRDVKLTVVLPAGKGSRSFVTDSHGTVMLRDLPDGTNCVTATDENNFRGDLCLAVPRHSARKISSFNLNLSPYGFGLSPNDEVKTAEKNLAPERFLRLDGTVLDQAGAVISQAEIQVYKRGSYPHSPVAKVWTDGQGRFTVPLNPDHYTVVIQRTGFKTGYRIIEISPEGAEGQLREILQIGLIC